MDLTTQVAEAATWPGDVPGQMVVANMAYADGANFGRVAVAADMVSQRLRRDRPDTALAFLATPTDAFAVPGHDVDLATAA